MADAVDMTSARGAGADGRCTGASPPTMALEMKPDMLENRLMMASLSTLQCTDTHTCEHKITAFKKHIKQILVRYLG